MKRIVLAALVLTASQASAQQTRLDVFQTEPLPAEHPFVSHPKVLVTPHIASLTPVGSVAPKILENYQRALQGRPLHNQVDPAVGY